MTTIKSKIIKSKFQESEKKLLFIVDQLYIRNTNYSVHGSQYPC